MDKEAMKRDLRCAINDNGVNIVVSEYIDKLPEDTPQDTVSLIRWLCSELKHSSELHTLFVNDLIAMSVKDHVINGKWPQLSSLKRSLFSDMEVSMRNEDENIKNIVGKSNDLERRFSGLNIESKEKALNLLKERK